MSKLNIKTIEEEIEEELNCLCNLYLANKDKEAKCQKDRVMETIKEISNQIFDICVGEEKEVCDAVVCRSEGYNKKRAEIIQLKEEFNN